MQSRGRNCQWHTLFRRCIDLYIGVRVRQLDGVILNANVLHREWEGERGWDGGSDFEQLSRRDVINVKGNEGVGLVYLVKFFSGVIRHNGPSWYTEDLFIALC